MGTNSNPGRIQEGGNGGGWPTPSNGAAEAAEAENSATSVALKHDPGLSFLWSVEEQTILEEGLIKYAAELSLNRYAKIAKELQAKTMRDVALRCKWMSKKENTKKRKDDHNLSKKSKDKRERTTDPSTKPSAHLASRPSVPPFSLPQLPLDNDDDISYQAIGGSAGQLLENTDQIFKQISQNLSNFQVQENVQLLYQAQTNLYQLLNGVNDIPGVMRQMPPLPVAINEELANSVLSSTPMPMQT